MIFASYCTIFEASEISEQQAILIFLQTKLIIMKNELSDFGRFSFLRKLLIVTSLVLASIFVLIAIKGCVIEDDDDVQPVVLYQIESFAQTFQQNGINLILDDVVQIDNAGTTNSDKINYLIANSYIFDMDSTGNYVSVRLSNISDQLKTNLFNVISGFVGNTSTLVFEITWSYNGQKISSIALVDESTYKIMYAAVSSNLTLKQGEMNGAIDRFVGYKEVAQPTNPGDLCNRWGENIFGMDLFTVAISWGTAYCDEEGCITIPNNPNMWIQVEIETSLGWTADAVVTGFQVSPDCKSVTFQVTIVAAGPLATVDISTNAEGVKVGANVTGPVGTYKKTFNATWRCS